MKADSHLSANTLARRTADYRTALGCFATGVTIVCGEHNGEKRGWTANSFSSVSLQPPLISVCLDSKAGCMDVFAVCDNFSVSVLTRGQKDLAHRFAYFQGDRFADIAWGRVPSGCPMIENSLAWFDCAVEDRLPLGDHIMFIGRVTDFACGADGLSPLVFFGGDYC